MYKRHTGEHMNQVNDYRSIKSLLYHMQAIASYILLIIILNKRTARWNSWCTVNEHGSHLHTVLDLSSVVSDDKRWLHDGRKLDVAVPFVLPLELVQQRLVSGLWEAEHGTDKVNEISRQKFTMSLMWATSLEPDDTHRKLTQTEKHKMHWDLQSGSWMWISCL